MSEILADPVFEERTLEETSQQADCVSKVAWILARKMYRLKAEDKATFCSPVNAPERHRRSYICYGFGSFNAQC